jgi:S1-C subfamily serine protease
MLRAGVALSVAAGLCACTSYKKPLPSIAPMRSEQVFKFSDLAKQARLSAIVFDLPPGYRYGEEGFGTSGSCYRKHPMVNMRGRFEFEVAKYTDLFNSVMKMHGYPVDEQIELFRDSKERIADVQVAARIIEATLNECRPEVVDNDMKVVGNAYLKVEWSVYSTIQRKVIFTAITEGSTYQDVESTIGETGIVRPALADAVERLAMVPGYREAIDPPKGVPVAKTERFKIKRTKRFTGDVKSNIDAIRKAVATVTANKGFGSGFVISEDGIVLTAGHLVSGSRFVKVNTAAGKECYGEVVASSKQRDLAIIRVDCPDLTALPLGREKIVEGSEVFAIGTPLSEKLQFSVTKGVVSGMRKIDEMDYIQSDVVVLPGNSGGPLLDVHGNVVGITISGIATTSAPVGVNFFVPLTDLDKYLPVDLE